MANKPLIKYIEDLPKQRDLLVDILKSKGIDATKQETFNTLIPKISDIESSGHSEFDSIPEFQEYDLPEELVYNSGNIYTKQLDMGDVVFSTDANGIWVFDVNTGETTKRSELNARTTFYQKGNLCAIYGADGLCLYSCTTKQFIELTSIGTSWLFLEISDDHFLITTTVQSNGLFLCNHNTGEVIIKDGGYNWREILTLGEKVFIASTNSYSFGLYIFDTITGSFETLLEGGYNWRIFEVTENEFLFSSQGASINGVFLYEKDINKFSRLYADGYNYNTFQLIDDVCLIGSTSYSGVLRYDLNSKTITPIFLEAGYRNTFSLLSDSCLITGTGSTSLGVLVYSFTEKTIVARYSAGYSWTIRCDDGDNFILSSNAVDGLLLYNRLDKSFKVLSTSNRNWKLISSYEQDGNNFLLSPGTTTGVKGLYLYKSHTDEFKTINNSLGNNAVLIHDIGSDLIIQSDVYLVSYTKNTETANPSLTLPNNNYSYTDVLEVLSSNNVILASYSGLLVYNYEEKSFKNLWIISNNTGSLFSYKLNDTDILFTSSAVNGIQLYSDTDLTLSVVESSGNGYNQFQIVGDICAISSSLGSNKVHIYDINQKIKLTSSANSGFYTYKVLKNNDIIFYTSRDSSYIAYLYNSDTYQLNALHNNEYLNVIAEVENGDYLILNSVYGYKSLLYFYLYDVSNRQVIKTLHSINHSSTNSIYYRPNIVKFITNSDSFIFNQSTSQSYFSYNYIYIYNNEEKVIKSIYSVNNMNYQIIKETDKHLYIVTTNYMLFIVDSSTYSSKDIGAGFTYVKLEDQDLIYGVKGLFIIDYETDELVEIFSNSVSLITELTDRFIFQDLNGGVITYFPLTKEFVRNTNIGYNYKLYTEAEIDDLIFVSENNYSYIYNYTKDEFIATTSGTKFGNYTFNPKSIGKLTNFKSKELFYEYLNLTDQGKFVHSISNNKLLIGDLNGKSLSN